MFSLSTMNAWIARLALLLSCVLFLPRLAHAGPTECLFSADQAPSFGVRGDLRSQASVDVHVRGVYYTPYQVKVRVWIDHALIDEEPEAAALALSYFEHANCIYALGQNKFTGQGDHEMSLRLADDKLRKYLVNTPFTNGGRIWIQQLHWDFKQFVSHPQVVDPTVKLELLITSRNFVDLDKDGNWVGVGGASNGVGQGQAIVAVNPNALRNTAAVPHNEDWWGVIVAHEISHALGRGGHVAQKYDVMCCSANDYTNNEKGYVPSRAFSQSSGNFDLIRQNDIDTADNWSDPYKTTKNPRSHENWDYQQVSDFLRPYTPADAMNWVRWQPGYLFGQAACRNDSADPSGIVCNTGPAYQRCRAEFSWSPVCTYKGGSLAEPCCRFSPF